MTEPNSNRQVNRLSLTWVFTVSLVCIFLVYLFVSGLAYYRLLNVNQILENIAQNETPKILLFDEISNEATSLVFYTEQLANAKNPPSLRIAESGALQQLSFVDELITQGEFPQSIRVEYSAINAELKELIQLVDYKINIATQIKLSEQLLYSSFSKFLADGDDNSSGREKLKDTDWGQSFSNLITLSSQIMSISRIHEISRINEIIEQEFHVLNTDLTIKLPANERPKAKAFNRLFRLYILSGKGLVKQRNLQLRIEGRTRGRGEFTKKLVSDFSRSVRFQTQQLNGQIISETERTNKFVSQQINIVGLSTLLALLLLAVIGMILKSRVIERLTLLNQLVLGHLDVDKNEIKLQGNDEITDIAHTFKRFTQTIEQQKKALSVLAMSDGLTGIANRRAFDEELDRQITVAKRLNHQLSVLLIDIDFFKLYNDKYGHIQGDEALVNVANELKKSLNRNIDFIARYGGEEFVCILPNTDTNGALKVAKRLSQSIKNLNIPHQYSSVASYITISSGSATLKPEELNLHSHADILVKADKALYQAKEAGRNQSFTYSD